VTIEATAAPVKYDIICDMAMGVKRIGLPLTSAVLKFRGDCFFCWWRGSLSFSFWICYRIT